MSLLPQDELNIEIERGRESLKNCLNFIQDNDFYERLVENPDWLKAKEGLTKELSELKLKRDDLLKTLVETRGSQKVDVQDGILECQIRVDQTDAFLEWFSVKVSQLKIAREQLPEIKAKLNELKGSLHG